MMKFLSLLIVVFLIFPEHSLALPGSWDFEEGTAPRITKRSFFYDPEGRTGLIWIGPYPSFETQNGFTELYLPSVGLQNPYWTHDELLIYTELPENIAPVGSPYYFKFYHPSFGCVASGGYIGTLFGYNSRDRIDPYIMLPVNAEDSGTTITTRIAHEDFDVSTNQWVSINFILYVADYRDKPSLMVPLNYANNEFEEWNTTVVFEYLPGNVLEELEVASWEFTPTAEDVSFQAVWSDLNIQEDWDTVLVNHEIPRGPMRVTVGVDGYTSDTLNVNVENLRGYTFNVLLTPLPGPEGGPGVGELDLVPDLQAAGAAGLILDNCPPVAPISASRDVNKDGITDSGDLGAFE